MNFLFFELFKMLYLLINNSKKSKIGKMILILNKIKIIKIFVLVVWFIRCNIIIFGYLF